MYEHVSNVLRVTVLGIRIWRLHESVVNSFDSLSSPFLVLAFCGFLSPRTYDS